MAFEERIEGPLGAGVHLCRQTLIGGQPQQRGGYEVSTAAAQDGVGAHARASIAWFVSAVLTATPGSPARPRIPCPPHPRAQSGADRQLRFDNGHHFRQGVDASPKGDDRQADVEQRVGRQAQVAGATVVAMRATSAVAAPAVAEDYPAPAPEERLNATLATERIAGEHKLHGRSGLPYNAAPAARTIRSSGVLPTRGQQRAAANPPAPFAKARGPAVRRAPVLRPLRARRLGVAATLRC